MKLTVIGTGYVGLITGACLTDLGHSVTLLDIDAKKIKMLQNGAMPFFEHGMKKLVAKNVHAKRLTFTTSYAECIPKSHMVMLAVGTPSRGDGSADLHYLDSAAQSLAPFLTPKAIIVTKSTVPVGTGRRLQAIVRRGTKVPFTVASCPEFLREGSAIKDFFHSDRIIIGADDARTRSAMLRLFAKLHCSKLVTTLENAELIKYASNAFLATKISFVSEMAHVCEMVGADIGIVAAGMGMDKRIGNKFLHAGIGYGGSCFPKDVRALHQIASGSGYNFQLLQAVIRVNQEQRKLVYKKLLRALRSMKGKKIAVLGLAFKNNTDDVRESVSIEIVRWLLDHGAHVTTYDPIALPNAKKVLSATPRLRFCKNARLALRNADAVVIATEWKEFQKLPWKDLRSTMHHPIVVDGRNLLDPEKMREFGYTYASIGRK